MQDTIGKNLEAINHNQINHPILFVTDSLEKDTSIVDFREYIVKTLNSNTKNMVERKSLFQSKSYVNKDLKLFKRPNNQFDGWIYGLVFLVSILYIVVIKFLSKKIKSVISGTYNHLTLIILISFLFMPLLALIINIPISFYNYYPYFPIESHFAIYLLIYFAILLYCITKYLLIYFFGELFRAQSVCYNYNSNQLGFYFVDGIIMIPLLFLYYFTTYSPKNIIQITILIIISTLLLIRIIRGLVIVLSQTKFSKFYLFVYLCILEFIPLIIIYKSLI